MADVKVTALPEDTLPTTDDYTISVDTGSGATKKVKWEKVMTMAAQFVLPSVYPVGCIYTTVDSTNPGTTFGFGTWVAFGTGRSLVGYQSGDPDFGTVAATGGEKTHVLTTAELAAHNHTGTTDASGSHNHFSVDPATGQVVFTSGSTNSTAGNPGTFQQITWGNAVTSTNGNHQHTITTNNTGSGTAHNNLQPFIVVYFWKRTA